MEFLEVLRLSQMVLSLYIMLEVMTEKKSPQRKYILLVLLLLSLSLFPKLLAPLMNSTGRIILRSLPLRHWIFLLGPTLYLYQRSSTGQYFRPYLLFHLIPFLFWAVVGLVSANDFLSLPKIFSVYGISNFLSFLFYGIFILVNLQRYSMRMKNQISFENLFLELKWLKLIMGSFLLLTLLLGVLHLFIPLFETMAIDGIRESSSLPHPRRQVIASPVVELFHTYGAFLFTFLFSFFAVKQNRVAKSGIDPYLPSSEENAQQKKGDEDISLEKEFQNICRFMDESRIYLDNQLTLQNLSDKVQVSRNELSKIINRESGENFFHFINGYRAREFERAISEDRFPQFNLLGIAHECGFNSKSTFNGAVKKEFSLTPSQLFHQKTDFSA